VAQALTRVANRLCNYGYILGISIIRTFKHAFDFIVQAIIDWHLWTVILRVLATAVLLGGLAFTVLFVQDDLRVVFRTPSVLIEPMKSDLWMTNLWVVLGCIVSFACLAMVVIVWPAQASSTEQYHEADMRCAFAVTTIAISLFFVSPIYFMVVSLVLGNVSPWLAIPGALWAFFLIVGTLAIVLFRRNQQRPSQS
jgi:hypothetical protein